MKKIYFFIPLLFMINITGCLSQNKRKQMDLESTDKNSEFLEPVNEASKSYFADVEEIKKLNLTGDQDNFKGYWSNGVIIGTMGQLGKKGSIFLVNELEVFQGAGLLGSTKKPYTPKTLWVRPFKDQVLSYIRQAKTTNPINTPFVFKFINKHPLKISLLGRSRIFAYELTELKPFEKSPSYRKFGYEFKEPDSLKGRGKIGEGNLEGHIVQVNRWGFLGKRCIVYLTVDDQEVPLTSMVAPSKEGCSFAEDVAQSGKKVRVNISFKTYDIWNMSRRTVHEMFVL